MASAELASPYIPSHEFPTRATHEAPIPFNKVGLLMHWSTRFTGGLRYSKSWTLSAPRVQSLFVGHDVHREFVVSTSCVERDLIDIGVDVILREDCDTGRLLNVLPTSLSVMAVQEP
jgi:hypothetical protein